MKPLALLFLASLASAALPKAVPAPGPTLEAPPGWHDMKAEGKARTAVIALKGPEAASFIVKRAPTAALDNPAAVRGFLNDVLGGMRDASKQDFHGSNRIETRVFRNGLTAQMLRAQLNGEDRLVIALFAANGGPHLAVLMSAAPEAMLPSLLGNIQLGKLEGAIQSSGIVRSLDGQLEVAVGGGLRGRALLDAEAAKGFVLAVQGSGSEILFQKLSEVDATKPAEQAAIVREMAAASAGVASSKASQVFSAPTAAGPIGVYSWAPAPANDKMSVGYLPWGYWGYQIFGRGPSADELLVGVLAAMKAGPSAVPGLLANTPQIPIEKAIPKRRLYQAAGALALLVVIGLVWSLSRKSASLHA
jgi:hypothetical protein